MSARGVLCAAVIASLLAACSARPPEVGPTLNEALGFLDRLVALAQQGDFGTLCATAGDSNCDRKLDEAGRDRVPPQPPTVRTISSVPTTRSGDQTSRGGLVLGMCGTDARGGRYESEMLVFRDGDGTLRAINPVYWGHYTIATSGETTVLRTPGPGDCEGTEASA
jgi:hypothetical protein